VGQILNLVQHIEDGFEKGKVTGVAFVDLTAAYDTVNHNRLLYKLYAETKDYKLVQTIGMLLSNRRFYVTLQGRNSRWRTQKNGLPQGGVLAPILYNIYTNDQLIAKLNTKLFIYADDTAIAAQNETFDMVERSLSESLHILGQYYKENNLRPNPQKTQLTAFHLKNKESNRKLNVKWMGQTIENCDAPRYLGVTLDRSLTYKEHCMKTKQKVCARNNILRKLTGTTWGASPSVLRTSAQGLCLSAAEYACPVWQKSAHSKQVDIAVNEMARIITGCLKPTPINKLYPIIGIAPPYIRRRVAADAERFKQTHDHRHPLYNHQQTMSRLKSRNSFIKVTSPIEASQQRREELWRQDFGASQMTLKEATRKGEHLPFPLWSTLNRLRVGVTRCRVNIQKWGQTQIDSVQCECGEVQDDSHLLTCPLTGVGYSPGDLFEVNDKAMNVVTYWSDRV
jgi:hypothetical protein